MSCGQEYPPHAQGAPAEGGYTADGVRRAMRTERRVLGGLLLVIAGVQFLLAMLVAEGMRPGYSISADAISDLGVGSTALLFNTSVAVLGILILLFVYLYHTVHRKLWITIPYLVAGIGPIGVGLFPETMGTPHAIFAFISFFFGSIVLILVAMVVRAPFRYVSVVLGVLGLAALALFASGTFLGIGLGGMERMIAYPVIFWGIAFGGYLMSSAGTPAAEAAASGSA